MWHYDRGDSFVTGGKEKNWVWGTGEKETFLTQ